MRYPLLWLQLVLLLVSPMTYAIELEYDGFYNYLNEANEIEFNLVRPAFFLKNDEGKPCSISDTAIRVEHREEPLLMEPQLGQFFVPLDKRLKDARATIWFATTEQCKLQVAVVGRPLGQRFSSAQQVSYADQMYALMQRYAGMAKVLLPEWSAVVFIGQEGQEWHLSRAMVGQEAIELPWPVSYLRLQMVEK